MAAKQGGLNIGTLVLVLIAVLILEAVVDVFGLPFDEIIVPGEIIGDIMLVVLMTVFFGIGYTPPPRRIQ